MRSVISWTSSERRLYQLDRSEDLSAWVLGDAMTGEDGTTTIEVPWDPLTLFREFHRVQVSLPPAP